MVDAGPPEIDNALEAGAADDERIRLPGSALRSAFLGFLAALVAGIASAIAASVVLAVVFGSEWFPPIVVASLVGTWGVLLHTLRRMSRRHGSGDLFRDFGFRVRLSDVVRGFGLLLLAYVAAAVVVSVLAANPDLQGTNTGEIADQRDSIVGTLVLGLVTIVGAPIVEELFFRGLVQRALEPRFGEVAASLLQAVAFGLVHFQPGLGLGNVSVVLITGTLGAVLGQGARIWKRLGPSMVAHALFNTVAVLATLATT